VILPWEPAIAHPSSDTLTLFISEKLWLRIVSTRDRRASTGRRVGAVSGLRQEIRRDGAQPSNYMLNNEKGLKSAKKLRIPLRRQNDPRRCFGALPHLGQTTAWTGSPTIRPFIPPMWQKKSPPISRNGRRLCAAVAGLCAETGIKVVPMFWAWLRWEVATVIPGFLEGWRLRLIAEGQDRFVKKTARYPAREQARPLSLP